MTYVYLQKNYMYLSNVLNEKWAVFFLIFEKMFTDLLPYIDQ